MEHQADVYPQLRLIRPDAGPGCEKNGRSATWAVTTRSGRHQVPVAVLPTAKSLSAFSLKPQSDRLLESMTQSEDLSLLSVPAFWPMAMATRMLEEGTELYAKNLKFVEEEIKIHGELRPALATRRSDSFSSDRTWSMRRGGARGLEVSPCRLRQDHFVQGQVGDGAPEPSILRLKSRGRNIGLNHPSRHQAIFEEVVVRNLGFWQNRCGAAI
jgi:hypothetical protein